MSDTGTTTTTGTDAGQGGAKGAEQGKGGTTSTSTDDKGAGVGSHGGGGEGGEDSAAVLEKLRTENREAKREAAALRAKAAAFDKLEEASKTEQQKALDRAAAAEKDATEAKTRLLRYEVAAAKGVPAKLAGRLQGDTKEEMEADADDLLSTLGPGSGTGRTRTNGNAKDEGGAPAQDMSTILRRMAGRSA